MTSEARRQEANRVQLLYYWALNQLANQTVAQSLAQWNIGMPATEQAASTSAGWLADALELVGRKREQGYALGVAYYRLTRALHTGYTYADPFRGEEVSSTVTLDELREQFTEVVDELEAENGPEPFEVGPQEPTEGADDQEATDSDPLPESAPQEPEPEYDEDEPEYEDDEIVLEELARLDELIEQEEQAAEEQAAEVLDQLGPENMLGNFEQYEPDDQVETVDAQRNEAHRAAGRRVSAAASRITMNAARGLTFNIGEADERVVGWVRYSQTGHPCGWCARLLSRQALYKSERSAQNQGRDQEENKYHDNCRCVAVPVFSRAQFDESPLFALNRELHRMNEAHKKDTGNGLSLPEWRRRMRSRQQEAQEAA